jgi:hypothetical protein
MDAAPDDAEVVLVVGAAELKTKLFVSRHGREAQFPDASVIADPRGDIASHYKVIVSPYTVVVDTKGRVVAKGSATTGGEMWLLINQADRLTTLGNPMRELNTIGMAAVHSVPGDR